MNAKITYEVRRRAIEGEGIGGSYTERTLWRITTINNRPMNDSRQVAEFGSNAEADIFEEWLNEHSK